MVKRTLSSRGDARDTAATYHQQQLAREFGHKELVSINEASVRETIKAVWEVHDSNLVKKTIS